VSHTRASVCTEVDVRRDKKYVYTFVYITIDKWFVFFLRMYFLRSYSNARVETLLGGIWTIVVL